MKKLLLIIFSFFFTVTIAPAEENKKSYEFSLLPSYGIPVGTTARDLEAGYMQQFRFGLNISNTALWGLNFSAMNLSIKQQSLRVISVPSFVSEQMPLDADIFDGDINIIHIGLFYQHSIPIDISKIYFIAGCAYYNNKIKVKTILAENTKIILINNTDSDFGYFLGSGISAKVTETILVGLEVVFYHQFETGDDIQYIAPALQISFLF